LADFPLGHKPVGKRPNVRHEIARIKRDPIAPFFKHLNEVPDRWISSNFGRYNDAYRLYFLAVSRFLTNMSVVTRYMNGAYCTKKYGGKYTPYERSIASRYREVAQYTEFDITNCLIHTRILLDRVASLSRRFITTGNMPSFTSFSDHKKFFQKHTEPFGKHEPYAAYIRDKTAWFEMPLKEVRDKYVVHSAPLHSRFVGLPNNWEVDLIILRAEGSPSQKPFSQSTPVIVNVLRMSHDIETFLDWFCQYAIANTRSEA
jgi:hypothetical protein